MGDLRNVTQEGLHKNSVGGLQMCHRVRYPMFLPSQKHSQTTLLKDSEVFGSGATHIRPVMNNVLGERPTSGIIVAVTGRTH